jgi:FixJ family two-component response regulator
MSEATIIVIDDDPSARRGITRLVRASGLNVEPFASADDFLQSDLRGGPGCIVLDVRMPDMTGPELQEELSKADYCMPIVFLSGHADVPIAAHAMKKGAVDFLTKPVDADDLLAAVREALNFDEENRAHRAVSFALHQQLESLTPREHEVMTYVITGMLNKQIAGALNISEETVKIHRGRVMQKLAIVSVAELVRLCNKAGIEPAGESSQ